MNHVSSQDKFGAVLGESASIWCGGRKLKERESQHIGAPSPALTLPRSEQEEELLLPKRKIQLKENNASHPQSLGSDSQDWPLINGKPDVIQVRPIGNEKSASRQEIKH